MSQLARWAPPLPQALRLAWRPALAYLIFTFLGSVVLFATVVYYEKSAKDLLVFFLALTAGMIGVVAGQLVAILRVRVLPTFIAGALLAALTVAILWNANVGEYVGVPLVSFAFAFPCGLLSLQHRWELFASFWPSIGWIGAVFVILNKENRVHQWEESKVSAWLPIPLLFLGGFLVAWLFYLAAKQAARVDLWQALSGAAARRVTKAQVAAVPRRNVLPILVVALVLFIASGILAPFLWRTGKGDRDGGGSAPDRGDVRPSEPQNPRPDGDAIVKQLQKLAANAKDTLPKLWPLLLLFVLYRPVKRFFLTAHLRAPLVPTPPSERIDNSWEYIRLVAEDAGIFPTPSDSVEQLVARIHAAGCGVPDLDRAAEIYVRTRYGFTVARGDALAMRKHADGAGTALKKNIRPLARVRNWWRPLS
jgi:hypothetical protein